VSRDRRAADASSSRRVPQAAPSQASIAPTIIRRMMIETRDLEQTYLSGGRPLTVLRQINVAIAPREFVAVMGPSGSGKTTLLGLLAGLDRPTRGVVRLDGEDLGSLSEDARARLRVEKVGFVFQTFQLMPTLTALENVLVPLELRGGGGANGAAAEARARHCRAASSSGWGWRARSPPNPRCYSPMSPPAASTPTPAAPSSTCWSS
jgi:ABC-type glutathione transport system ATPase component